MDNIPPSIIRQTPPPPLTPAARKEGKTNPEMVGVNNRSTHTYCPRSCKRKRLTEIESLPDEVLFDVLVRLPAHDIYDSARLICSKWYHMIHTRTFIDANFQHSTYGLLFQSKYREDSVFLYVGESGRVEISKIRNNKLRCPVPTSCNGLVLELQRGSNYNLYVSNPATSQVFALPPFVGYLINYQSFAIGYAAASMEYKAAILVSPAIGKKNICCILTIGVDKSWRTTGSECVSLATTRALWSAPLITEGFVHWCDIATNDVLTMNLETEIFTETSGPTPKGKPKQWNTYLSTGRYLSLLRPCGDFCWEVWEMKPKIDYRWRKVWDISLESHKCSTFQRFGFHKYNYLTPIGWLKYLEVLIFKICNSTSSQILVFNLFTLEIVKIELPGPQYNYKIVVHKNSLLWFSGC
ncbi:hypothetical protein CASFOL_026455 [Castilleja foliolosa]|uniref:F-box domain-containing protein n=1 Tax=Castilleja foliolosa TaxID=1961234 RepID=A0ABD3CH51_9LAMI